MALQWAGQLGPMMHHAWVSGQAAATSAWGFFASLPEACGASILHATATCTGYRPNYFLTPGLAPLPLCWGWLVAGLLLGALARELLLFWLVSTHRGRRQGPAEAAREELLDRIRRERLAAQAAEARMDAHELLMAALRS